MLDSSFQHTLACPFTIEGVGVHSGIVTRLTVKPAPPRTGIIFIRTDVHDKNNVIPALWDHVVDTRLCTVLANSDGVRVSTVEHLLSAFAALGLDNAIVEIDGAEMPIMDGSAAPFVAAIDESGLIRQNEKRLILKVKRMVSYQEGDKEVYLSPAPETWFGFEISFDTSLIGRQKFTHRFDETLYRHEIAQARTFGFLHEVEQLRQAGLARGGSLENAIVIDGDKVLNPGGLRFKNEFVRHKILDAVGDIFLAGHRLLGHYHGVRAGHAMNNKALRALFAQKDAFELVEAYTAPTTTLPQKTAASRKKTASGRIYGESEAALSITA